MDNNESALGKQEYWEELYDKEIYQFNCNNDLVGYVWYGEQVQNKIIKFIKGKFNKSVKILDLGSGNAEFLINLYISGNYEKLVGNDYSIKSIELANKILEEKSKDPETKDIQKAIQLDIEDINNPKDDELLNNFDVIHDKGTFDAYMLCKDNSVENYLRYINGKFKKGALGHLIISSCNHTSKELQTFLMSGDINNFEFEQELPNKKFSFGGSTGQAATTLCFKVNN